jgi:hypothetical protein
MDINHGKKKMEIQTSKEYPLHPNLKMQVKWQAKRNFFFFFEVTHRNLDPESK